MRSHHRELLQPRDSHPQSSAGWLREWRCHAPRGRATKELAVEEAAGGTSEAQARAPGLKLETNESLAPPPGAAAPATPLLSGA
jgi:hypothetical protein